MGPGGAGGEKKSKYLVNIKVRKLEKSFVIKVRDCKPSGAPFVHSDRFPHLNIRKISIKYTVISNFQNSKRYSFY